jgi:lipopolysaccharide transport system permease protein
VTVAAPAAALVIEAGTGRRSLGLRDLWSYRELLYFLIWRDVKVRYKQTVLGAAWAILQPLLTALVFTLFFGRLAGISSEGLPYPLFAYAGLLAWTFFAQGLSQSAASLVGSANLITKVYFPRLVIPFSSVLAGLVDLAVALPVLAVFLAWYRHAPGPELLFFPAFLVLAVVTVAGVGVWLAALNVEYRDVRYVVPFLVQLWLFLTPVIYPSSAVMRQLERLGLPGWLAGVNPMAGVVEGFRWSLLGAPPLAPGLLAASVITAAVVAVSGVLYFRRVERSFADVV